jgi:hypothetical protein
MNQRQLSLLLGLALQTGCLVYDEPLRRDLPDAARDARRDVTSLGRDGAIDATRADAIALDVEARDDAAPDVVDRPDVAADGARDAEGDAPDARMDAAIDATIDGSADVASPPDVVDGGPFGDSGDAGPGDAGVTNDARTDSLITGCTVDFTVSGVSWDNEEPVEAGTRGVRLVGDLEAIGAWDTARGLAMIEKAPGAWAASLRFSDGASLEFKFVKIDGGRAPEWEQWPPFDSNRSLRVDCRSDGGTIWVDAGSDAGPASRAVGRSYGGAFGIRPLDATK